MWKEYGITGVHGSVNNSLRHPVAEMSGTRDHNRLYFFSDYVHLIKCIRNNLLNRKCFQVWPKSSCMYMYFEYIYVRSLSCFFSIELRHLFKMWSTNELDRTVLCALLPCGQVLLSHFKILHLF